MRQPGGRICGMCWEGYGPSKANACWLPIPDLHLLWAAWSTHNNERRMGTPEVRAGEECPQ